MGGCNRPLWSLHACPTLCTCALQPCHFGGPPALVQQLKVQPGMLRHLLHPFGRFLIHDFGFGLRAHAELAFFCFFMTSFPFAGARHAH